MRWTGAWLAAALCLVGAILRSAPAHGQRGRLTRVEGVAAVVGATSPGGGAQVILRSDVDLRARMRLAGKTQALALGPLPEALLAATLDEIIGEMLVSREADRLRAPDPPESAVRLERRRLERQSGGAARLARLVRALDADPNEVDEQARRRAYVAAFLQANLEQNVVVTEAQIDAAYEAGEHPFVGRPLSEVREVMRVWLSRRALERDMARWIEVLRARSSVHILASWRAE